MSDLISRQAAIELCLRYNGIGWVWSQILDELKEMPSAQPDVLDTNVGDMISRQTAIKAICEDGTWLESQGCVEVTMAERKQRDVDIICSLPSAQPEDYAELKREFLRMASYIDVLLECSDEQKETLIGFISRIAEFMPWTERD